MRQAIMVRAPAEPSWLIFKAFSHLSAQSSWVGLLNSLRVEERETGCHSQWV